MKTRLCPNVANTWNTTTFRRSGYVKTISDIMLAVEAIQRDIFYWKVAENYIGSDHQYMIYRVARQQSTRNTPTPPFTQWKVVNFKQESLTLTISRANDSILGNLDPMGIIMHATMFFIRWACDSVCPEIGRPIPASR